MALTEKTKAPILISQDRQHSDYWMRSVSFAGLQRIIKAVAEHSTYGVTAGGLNKLVLKYNLLRTQKNSIPSLTTLYHYRNTLIHLRLLNRGGRILSVNREDPDVSKLVQQPIDEYEGRFMSDEARGHFASLVFKNTHCRSLFFDLFMPPSTTSYTLNDFTQKGSSVTWSRYRLHGTKAVIFRNKSTGRTARCISHSSVSAVLYGLRYWARDELKIIDEYSQKGKRGNVMFPLSQTDPLTEALDSSVLQTVDTLLSLRIDAEWTIFSISELIIRCCEEQRQPISVLFSAIDWLVREWPHHIVLIPTSRSMATLTATSSQRQELELKRYYKTPNSPYISHVRIHKDVEVKPKGVGGFHVRNPSEVQA